MTCGIYKITELETGRCYIGQSKNVEKRWKRHHKRFPTSDFSYEIVIKCIDETEILDFWERFCIADFKAKILGFNLTKGGNGAWGSKNPEETSRKLSEAFKGRKRGPQSPEHLAKLIASRKGRKGPNLGKKFSDETRAKMSESHLRRKK